MRLFVIIWLVGITPISYATDPSGSYVVLAPKTFRSNLPYGVSVKLLKAVEPIMLSLRIRDSRNVSIAQAWRKDVQSGAPVTLQIPSIPGTAVVGESYKVLVKAEFPATGRILFEAEHAVVYEPKSLSIFVQFDKSIYKPGSTVHFRLIVVKPDLKPWTNGTVQIQISDPNNNVITFVKSANLRKGVYTGQLSLAEETILGDWKMEVTADRAKLTKTFSVGRYILPPFEVSVMSPQHVTVKDDIPVTISAKYTYGKNVKGSVTLFIQEAWNDELYPESNPFGYNVTTELGSSGKSEVILKNEDLRRSSLIADHTNSDIRLIAVVTEKLTGIQRIQNASVSVHLESAKVKINKRSDTFKPGLDFSVTISVVTHDGEPLSSAFGGSLIIRLKYQRYFVENKTDLVQKEEFKVQLDQQAKAEVTLKPPVSTESFRVEAVYMSGNGELKNTLQLTPSKSPTNSFIQLIPEFPMGNAYKVGDTLSFRLEATWELEEFNIQILSKGSIAMSQSFEANNSSFSLLLTEDMAPNCRLIAYAIHSSNKELVVDSVDLRVVGIFKNKVAISLSQNESRPGEMVDIIVTADSDSFVGLLAVDQSVLLLKSGGELSADLINQELSLYDTVAHDQISHWYRRVSGIDSQRTFENSGLLVLTDAYVYGEAEDRVWVDFSGSDSDDEERHSAVLVSDHVDNPADPTIPVKVRRNFPETWIWTDLVSDADGVAVYKASVPDTITTWVTSAFAISEGNGIGLPPDVVKLRVFRPFFIRLNLPYSVKRGETLALQVLIFNYHSKPHKVHLTLERNTTSGFNFVHQETSETVRSDPIQTESRWINVEGFDGVATVYFPIVFTVVSKVKLLVSAVADEFADAVEQELLVEADGFPVYSNKPLLIDLNNQSSVTTTVAIDVPNGSKVIEGSEFAEFTIVGDIMGSVLNIEELIRMPYGCGEQNMLNFVPNIVVWKYLNAAHLLTLELSSKLKKFLQIGYQQELTFMRNDNSFSAFGHSDRHGSTWLTAFVVRSFKMADQMIFIDPNLMENSLKYLELQQKETGEFEELGEVHMKSLQGGSAGSTVALTAYVLVALLTNGRQNNDAVMYLEMQLDMIKNDPYALAITGCALTMAKSPKKSVAVEQLQRLSVHNDGFSFWKAGDSESSDKRPIEIEIASYAVLALLLNDRFEDATPIVRWLVSQRNSLGGFVSTQDTVMGIQALAAYVGKTNSGANLLDMTVTVTQQGKKQTVIVNKENSMVTQKLKIDSINDPVVIEANGKGVAFAQVAWHYNMAKLDAKKPFLCDSTVKQPSTKDDLTLQMCCKYNLADGRSNMAVIQIDSLSGFALNAEQIGSLTGSVADLQRVEVRHADTQAALYFNSIGSTPVCFNVSSRQIFSLTGQKPSLIRVIDYYEPSNQIELQYSPLQTVNLDELCEGGGCWTTATGSSLSLNQWLLVTLSVSIYYIFLTN